MLKTELLKLLPPHVEYVVFIDSDIITTQGVQKTPNGPPAFLFGRPNLPLHSATANCVPAFLHTNLVEASWEPTMGIRARWTPGSFVSTAKTL
eukprot:scaffold2321_cov245-Pinguiococcus_pyrenoidosus.AAC.9